MIIGSHVSLKGKPMFLGSAEEAASYQANALMVYTGAPQNTKRRPIDEMNIPAGKAFMSDHGIDTVIVHAPYIVNLGNTLKPEKFPFAVDFLREEVKRADALGASQIVLHPGAHVGAGDQAAIDQIAKGLNEIITPEQNVHIAIETMAGKGTEVGRTFEQIRAIIDQIDLDDKVSVCFDTCHTNDAGYNVKEDFDGVLAEFDQIIGLDRLQVIHLNDSKNERGAHKDRHMNIGFGTIGFDALNYVAHHPALENVPKILETPYVGEDKKHQVAPYGREIAMLRASKFDPDMMNELTEESAK